MCFRHTTHAAMAWRGFGAINPASREVGPSNPTQTAQNQALGRFNTNDHVSTTLVTPHMKEALSMQNNSDHTRRNAVQEKGSTTKRPCPPEAYEDQIRDNFTNYQGNPAELGAEAERLAQKNVRGLQNAATYAGVGAEAKGRRRPEGYPIPPKATVINRQDAVGDFVDGGNTEVGLVLPAMQREHGLPLNWLPHGADQEKIAKPAYHAGTTGLLLNSMATGN